MDLLGLEKKRRRDENEESPSKPTADPTAADGVREFGSTTVHGTKRKKRDQRVLPPTEQENKPFINSSQEEKEEWLVVARAKGGEPLSLSDSDEWSVMEAPCARWCFMSNDGNYQWDDTKLKCLLSEKDRTNQSLLRKFILGTAASSQFYPLIFDISTAEDDEMVWLRSQPFFEQLIADKEDGEHKYRSLSDEQKRIVALGVRDLYLAVWQGLLKEQEKQVLDGMVKLLDESTGFIQACGMDISFHPSANFKVLKFLQDVGEAVGPDMAPFFAQVMETPKLFAVFVNPVELSFHNFENIVPLDRWIESKQEDSLLDELSLELTDPHYLQTDRDIVRCNLRGNACDLMKELSSLNLYIPPLNHATRGGERFIFHSALLSKVLTKAVRTSGLLSKFSKHEPSPTFEFVNYVFRCNKFVQGDAKFSSHLDTPYYDAARSQVSKYTMVIYLSAGHGDPALSVDDVKLTDIEEMTCVIFDQRYKHEGQAFMDSDKIFIRTELIFQDENLGHNGRIPKLFSEACYMTGHTVFDDQLASYAHECFERANSLHWAIEQKSTQDPVYLHKRFQGMPFLTNGYDYWFPKHNSMNAADCGMMAVLDYLNCKLAGKPFRSMCQTTTVRRKFKNTEEALAYFEGQEKEQVNPFRRLKEADVETLFKRGPNEPFTKRPPLYEYDDEEEYEDEDEPGGCCPTHCYRTFDAWEDEEDVGDDYKTCCNFIRSKLFGVPLLVLNQEIVINESNIKIEEDKMYFLHSLDGKTLPPINFAACWMDIMSHAFIGVDQEINTLPLLIPPIVFHESGKGYHLVLDLFRNDWMIQVDEDCKVPVPVIINDLPVAEDGDPTFVSPFLEKLVPQLEGDQDFTSSSLSEFFELPEVSEVSEDEIEPPSVMAGRRGFHRRWGQAEAEVVKEIEKDRQLWMSPLNSEKGLD
jgi:hypothetical protein